MLLMNARDDVVVLVAAVAQGLVPSAASASASVDVGRLPSRAPARATATSSAVSACAAVAVGPVDEVVDGVVVGRRRSSASRPRSSSARDVVGVERLEPEQRRAATAAAG